jgi:hypothetical protein
VWEPGPKANRQRGGPQRPDLCPIENGANPGLCMCSLTTPALASDPDDLTKENFFMSKTTYKKFRSALCLLPLIFCSCDAGSNRTIEPQQGKAGGG